MDPLAERVLSVLASVKHIPRERVSLESSLQDLGFDSLDKVTMLFEIEKQFQISVPDEELGSIRNVRDVVAGIACLVANAPGEPSAPETNP